MHVREMSDENEKIPAMKPLPPPADLTSLVLRTDFSDDTAWDELRATLEVHDPHGTSYVDDPAYSGVSVQALIDASANDQRVVTYLFLADATTMADKEHPLLAVDLFVEPGRTFRVPPSWYPEISDNLSIANMDFAEFAEYTDDSGTYRGFDDS